MSTVDDSTGEGAPTHLAAGACRVSSTGQPERSLPMKIAIIPVVAAAMLALTAQVALAQNKCTAKGVMAGQKFELAQCEVAYYAGSNGVTVWFSSTPITADERSFFQLSSTNDKFKQGRTMVTIAFCPGGGSPTPSPATAKS